MAQGCQPISIGLGLADTGFNLWCGGSKDELGTGQAGVGTSRGRDGTSRGRDEPLPLLPLRSVGLGLSSQPGIIKAGFTPNSDL
jgi:hypothetical protein